MEIVISRENPEYWNNIYLIGYMGTGKTSVSKHLSKLLDMPAIELDKVIEDYYGKSIPDIFDDIGEEGFRAVETLVLATAITGCYVPYDLLKGAVFSCGGGVPLNETNVVAMQNSGRIVWLTATPETVLARLTQDAVRDADRDSANGRPLLKNKLNLSDISEMMEIRKPYYEGASDVVIETDGKTPEEIAGEILIALDLIPTIS